MIPTLNTENIIKKNGRKSTIVRLLRELFRNPFAAAAAIVLLLIIVISTTARIISPYPPTLQNLMIRVAPPAWQAGGSWAHILGTDLLGRDILTRVFYGGEMSLSIGVIVCLIAGTFGTIIGMLAGFLGGRFDSIVMRFVDFQAAIPYFLLALTIMAAIGPGAKNLIIVLSIGSWVIFARYARGAMLSIRREVYIDAARVVGGNEFWIMAYHALPNLASPLVTLATLELSRVILSEASLSYLGVGVQPPQTSWGLMVAEGHDYLSIAIWLTVFPGLMIALTTLSINVFATWLRQVTDPVQRGRM